MNFIIVAVGGKIGFNVIIAKKSLASEHKKGDVMQKPRFMYWNWGLVLALFFSLAVWALVLWLIFR